MIAIRFMVDIVVIAIPIMMYVIVMIGTAIKVKPIMTVAKVIAILMVNIKIIALSSMMSSGIPYMPILMGTGVMARPIVVDGLVDIHIIEDTEVNIYLSWKVDVLDLHLLLSWGAVVQRLRIRSQPHHLL